jgi:hypothetical protein
MTLKINYPCFDWVCRPFLSDLAVVGSSTDVVQEYVRFEVIGLLGCYTVWLQEEPTFASYYFVGCVGC